MTRIDLTGPPRPWPPALARRFAAAQVVAARGPGAWRTPPPDGDPYLIDRLVELVGVAPELTTVTGGVRQLAYSLAGRTRRAVVERPSFADILRIFGGYGRVDRADWEGLPDLAARLPEPAMCWLTSPGRNPDGRSLSGADRMRLAALASQGHRVVVNQVYRWFEDPTSSTLEAPSGSWVAGSLSKLCGSGAALGWVCRPEPAGGLAVTGGFGPPTTWQRAWARFLTARTFAAMRAEFVEPTRAARDAFVARTAELLGWRCGGGRYCLSLEVHGGTETAALASLAEVGVQVSPGAAFEMPVPSVRLAFSGTSPAGAVTAADRIAQLAHGLRREVRLRPLAGTPVPSTSVQQICNVANDTQTGVPLSQL